MNITKGQIGNALTSVAADHVVAVTNDIYDETLGKYQSEINAELSNESLENWQTDLLNNLYGSGTVNSFGTPIAYQETINVPYNFSQYGTPSVKTFVIPKVTTEKAGVLTAAQYNTITSNINTAKTDITACETAIEDLNNTKAEIEDLSNILGEEVIDNPLLEEINTLTREEIKKDLFIDLWCNTYPNNRNNIGYNANTDRFYIKGDYNNKTYGFDDITYEEALGIYNRTVASDSARYSYNTCNNMRVNIPPYNYSNPFYTVFDCSYHPNLEYLFLCFSFASFVSLNPPFVSNCPKIKAIIGACGVSKNVLLDHNPKLEHVFFRLNGGNYSIHLKESPLLNLESLQFAVAHAENTGTVTIIVHDDVFAKLTGDTTNAVASALTSEELSAWQQVLTDATAKNIQFTNVN